MASNRKVRIHPTGTNGPILGILVSAMGLFEVNRLNELLSKMIIRRGQSFDDKGAFEQMKAHNGFGCPKQEWNRFIENCIQ